MDEHIGRAIERGLRDFLVAENLHADITASEFLERNYGSPDVEDTVRKLLVVFDIDLDEKSEETATRGPIRPNWKQLLREAAPDVSGHIERVLTRFERLLERRDDARVLDLLTTAIAECDAQPRPCVELWLDGVAVQLPREIDSHMEITADEDEYWHEWGFGPDSSEGPTGLLRHFLDGTGMTLELAVDRMKSFVAALRIELLTPVYEKRRVVYRDGKKADDVEVPARTGSWLEAKAFGRAEAGRMMAFWPAWNTAAFPLRAAEEHFQRAILGHSPVETAVYSVISLEALLADRADSAKDKKSRVRRRAPAILEEHSSRQAYLDEILGAAYVIRGGFVHGDNPEDVRGRLEHAARTKGRRPEDLAREFVSATAECITRAAIFMAERGATVDGLRQHADLLALKRNFRA